MTLQQAKKLAMELHGRTGEHYAVAVKTKGRYGWDDNNCHVILDRAKPEAGYHVHVDTRDLLGDSA